ncbi:hypothetical protein BVRB_035010, partial [Beta vulgaris subsp. vulgaris]
MPLGVCFVLAKYLQSRRPSAQPQLSAMNLLVQATRATDGVNPDSSSDEEDYNNGMMNRISAAVVTAQIKQESPTVDGVAASRAISTPVTPPPSTVRHSGTHECPYCPK